MAEILIVDLPERVSGGLREAAGVGEGWVRVDFETESLKGTGVATGASSGAPALEFELGLEGRYRLFLALSSKTAIRAWLTGDEGMTEIVPGHGGYAAQECPLSPADLTGKKLHIEPKPGPEPSPVFLAWIRAEPVSEPKVSARSMVVTNDGSSWIFLGGYRGEREVWKLFEPLRDSDVGLMLWGPGGADWTINHRTKVGTTAPTTPLAAFREYERTAAEGFRRMLDQDDDVLKTAVRAARDVGVKIHFYIRPEAFFCPFPYDQTFASRFFLDHPEWWCRDEFGEQIHRLSYAYPEVQQHMLRYMDELLEYGPDGLCLAFNRSLPMMICEEPVVREFERLHGRTPRLPEESDSAEMAAARSSLLTGFLRQVKAKLDEHGLEFTCMAGPNVWQNKLFGLDLLGVGELFSGVMLHNGGMHSAGPAKEWEEYWPELNRLTQVYPNAWGGSFNHQETAKFLLEEVLEAGYPGGFLWDGENFTENPYNWHVLRRGGSPDFLRAVVADTAPKPVIQAFTRLQGVKLGRYHPGNSY